MKIQVQWTEVVFGGFWEKNIVGFWNKLQLFIPWDAKWKIIFKWKLDGFHSNRRKVTPKLLSKLWSEGSIWFYIRECEVLPLYDSVLFS